MGGLLTVNAGFLAAIATYDFLIAAMIIYVAFQSETYDEWAEEDENKVAQPTKDNLHNFLKRSHQIWVAVETDSPSARKAIDMLGTMLKKIDDANKANLRWPPQGRAMSYWQQQDDGGVPSNPVASLSTDGAILCYIAVDAELCLRLVSDRVDANDSAPQTKPGRRPLPPQDPPLRPLTMSDFWKATYSLSNQGPSVEAISIKPSGWTWGLG